MTLKTVRTRKGVALLLTLSIIAAMLGLMGVMFAYLDTARTRAGEKASILQATLIRNDLQKAFASLLGKPDKKTLQTIYGTPIFLKEKGGGFQLSIRCQPLRDRIPLVWLMWEEDEQRERFYTLARDLFDRLSDQANIREPNRLYQMIWDTYRGEAKREGIRPWVRRKKGIISQKEFEEILEEYRYEADDPRIWDVKWIRYFSFLDSDGNATGIDGDFVNPETISILYDIDLQDVKAAYRIGDLGGTLRELGEEKGRYEWLFMHTPSTDMECEADYTFMEKAYRIRLKYINRHIEDFQIEK
jgi:hypothetical protein